MISVRFQGKPFNITVIQVYAPTSNAEEAEVEQFYEDLQDHLELTLKKDVLFIIGDWNAKWLYEEALQIAEKRREAKGKGEKEGYTHLNAEFQRIARRDKKALLSDQCKETEENNRMGKTRDLFKKY